MCPGLRERDPEDFASLSCSFSTTSSSFVNVCVPLLFETIIDFISSIGKMESNRRVFLTVLYSGFGLDCCCEKAHSDAESKTNSRIERFDQG